MRHKHERDGRHILHVQTLNAMEGLHKAGSTGHCQPSCHLLTFAACSFLQCLASFSCAEAGLHALALARTQAAISQHSV